MKNPSSQQVGLLFSVSSAIVLINCLGAAFSSHRLLHAQSTTAAAPAHAIVHTYKTGSKLFLDNGTVKVGIDTAWGGTITDVIWHNMNFVNSYDNGREVQVALYDGAPYPPCGDCTGASGWDPVQGGDHFHHGSPVVDQKLGPDFLYTKTKPYQWTPENKGGDKDHPVSSDVFIEQWISFLPDNPSGIRVHYKVTYFGKEPHYNTFQEFPAVYTNWEYGKFVYYGGDTPWTNGPLSFFTMPDRPKTSPPLYDPEQWGALVNDEGLGLAVYVPGQYPYESGFRRAPDASKNSGANYFFPRIPFSFGPGGVLEGYVYLFAGDYKNARQTFYALHQRFPAGDFLPPYGFVDRPKQNDRVSGTIDVSGWAFDNTKVARVKVYVDEKFVGTADYGTKADVSQIWSHTSPQLGFHYNLTTSGYSRGQHVLGVDVEDTGGNTAVLSRIPLTIENHP